MQSIFISEIALPPQDRFLVSWSDMHSGHLSQVCKDWSQPGRWLCCSCWSGHLLYCAIRIDKQNVDGLGQYCTNSSALAMELLQSCTKPSMYQFVKHSLLFISVSSTICLFIKLLLNVSACSLRWMPHDTYRDKTDLFQAMALCPQATSQYPSQC